MENQNNYEVQITEGFTGEFIVPFENDYIEIQYGFNVNNQPEGYEINVNIHESFFMDSCGSKHLLSKESIQKYIEPIQELTLEQITLEQHIYEHLID